MARVLVNRRVVVGVAVVCAAVILAGGGRALAGTWRMDAAPGAQQGFLTAVSCGLGCTAVGARGNPVTATLAQRGVAAGWSAQSTPPLPVGDASEPAFSGVSCTSVSACIAVGTAVWSVEGCCEGDSAFAERWNGRHWSVLIDPSISEESSLSAVSCSTPRACIAVGDVGLGPNCAPSGQFCSFVRTIDRWDGKRWSIRRTPKSVEGLRGVSCTSANACMAVGGAVAERWNGTRWSVQRTAMRPRAALTSVSCSSATLCTAVGILRAGGSVAERWEDGRWTAQRLPKPAGNRFSELDGVSCPARAFCVAVGSLAGGVPQAEVWNGRRWSLRSVPLPPGATGHLSAVTCNSRRVCTAVGAFYGADRSFALVERYS